jgi:serine/threonine-protein kinase
MGRRIAVGGMGEVYEGFAKDLSRKVAIKRVLKDDDPSADMKDLFLREVAVAATLEHPNVIEVLDAGLWNNDLYLVMEYVEGASLAEVIEALRRHRRILPIEISCGIVAQVARGLAHAHQRALPDGTPLGIVHRDVAPENVLVAKTGLPKLVDFGLATLAGHNFTSPGTIRGRPRCLSPEQARGEAIDARSDIFALGGLMFELVSGQALYTDENLATLLWKVTSGEYGDLEKRLPGSDSDLIAILKLALAPDPNERFRSARELERALDSYRAGRGIRVDSGAIASVLQKVWPEVQRIRTEKKDEGPGELEGTQLVLPADRLDTQTFRGLPDPEKQTPPRGLSPQPQYAPADPGVMARSGSMAAALMGSTTMPPSLSSEIPRPTAPARAAGDATGIFSGESETGWFVFLGVVLAGAAASFLFVWFQGQS